MNRWILWAVVAVAVFFFLRPSVPSSAKLNPAEVQSRMKEQKDLQLVDVRTPEEFRSGHLSGAKNMPLDGLDTSAATLDKAKPLIVYCRSGHRSSLALKLLVSKGFLQAKHMDGGISAWSSANLPTIQ